MQYAGLAFIESAYIGLILAFSSTVVTVKFLSDKNQISTLHGRLIIGFAVVQDLIAVLALPLLANPNTIFEISLFGKFALGIIALFALAILLNRLVLPKLLKHHAHNQELFFLIVISTCLGFMYIANLMHFSLAVGAFIGGLTLSSLPYHVEALSRIRGLRDFFTIIFFASLGMQLSFSFGSFPLFAAIAMFLAVYVLNPLIFFLITYFAGYGSRTALTVGLALEQASEFSFILAAQALALGQMTQNVYSLAILVIIVSMATTPYIMENSNGIHSFLYSIFKRLFPKYSGKRFNRKLRELESLPKEELKDHIVVFGSGVFGNSIAAVLRNYWTVVLVDHNPSNVLANIGKKLYSIYGSADSIEVWKKANIEKARLVVSTIPDTEAAVRLIQRIQKVCGNKVVVFSRAHSFEDALKMYEAGAESVILPQVLGSNECLKQIKTFLESGKTISSKLKNEYIKYLKEKINEGKKFS
jgi:CPA2 family monovalent cation:H+ antiporter-2